MPEKAKEEPVREQKTGFNLYSLQSIQPEKFVKLVEKVLREGILLGPIEPATLPIRATDGTVRLMLSS
jgi:hypothetical protein